ncbi:MULTISPECIES: hypothetical protein [Paenibacillus]|uniref:Uncharacterized protein n=1 Tax=Paenibacillus artemisiicola TaxID=1172618 RepID=A0ABS3WG95_9BACL|nr:MULTISPECIES: hypothetical protein [Paenibacillus]MBO7747268.1 hypothetical protein [Paenibacillus artemisiicola]SFJ27329.1 hypothetical protein SAMN02799624_03954 [Paenibacillus sp. UNC496MF]
MYLAETATTALAKFDPMDIMMLLFTIVIFIGWIRLITSPKKNKFAIGWTTVSLLVFLFANYVMIFKVWAS